MSGVRGRGEEGKGQADRQSPTWGFIFIEEETKAKRLYSFTKVNLDDVQFSLS